MKDKAELRSNRKRILKPGRTLIVIIAAAGMIGLSGSASAQSRGHGRSGAGGQSHGRSFSGASWHGRTSSNWRGRPGWGTWRGRPGCTWRGRPGWGWRGRPGCGWGWRGGTRVVIGGFPSWGWGWGWGWSSPFWFPPPGAYYWGDSPYAANQPEQVYNGRAVPNTNGQDFSAPEQ